jgi:3-deoxy-D-manno-octulosonic-acid transferase
MYILYSLFLVLFRIVLGLLALFDSKIKRGVEGRKKIFAEIEKYYPTVNPLLKRILIHVSSFGELEQAKPVIAALKEKYPNVHIHLTFFSPSGYDNAVNSYKLPDIITYLPFDSAGDVNWFLDITKPDLVLFVRYDLWHNFVHEVHDRNIPMLLFSATFDLSLAKTLPLIRSLYRKTYSFINTICTISELDKNAIEKVAIHAHDIIVAGDTRCDQVIARRNAIEGSGAMALPENVMLAIASGNLKIFVAGSTWKNDEEVIIPVIRKVLGAGEKIITVIVPHEVDNAHINDIQSKFGSEAILFSAISSYKNEKVVIVDSIGKLFSLYQGALFAYVGGGFGSGAHNILEPSVWGVPSIVGPNHKRSKEIASLIGLSGAAEIRNAEEFEDAFDNWLLNDIPRTLASVAAKNFVNSSHGATEKIMEKIAAIQW